LDIGAIQQKLITSAIYGKKTLIADGYLVANPLLLGEIADVSRSLVGNLLMSGSARLFARGGVNLVDGIVDISSKVTTHKAIVESKQLWQRVKGGLETLERTVADKIIPWPKHKNMSHLFYLLMERLAGSPDYVTASMISPQSRKDFDDIFTRFANSLPLPFDGARGHWERMCWQHFRGSDVDPFDIANIRRLTDRSRAFPEYPAVRNIMNIANEVYHLAYSVGASCAVPSESLALANPSVGVSTALVTTFQDLLGEEAMPDTLVDRGKIQQLNQLIISVPATLRFNGDFSFINRIVNDSDVVNSRRDYLSAMEAFMADQLDIQRAMEARDTFRECLVAKITPAVREGTVLWAMGEVPGIMLENVPAVGWILRLGFDYSKSGIIERLLKQRVRVALSEEGIAATQSAVATPLARRLGFYVGPLKADGVQKLADLVGRHPNAPP